ncbi:ABC transporter permease [Streptomyces sp. CB01635]|uniref:ABC transporter permease n=1 Tax=unclassified Streptomyces TaxID=2593676 RepID=UPI000C27BF89|nr:FtsX-like permease family protein [Streptomyces sp. CB01635]PJN09501.1 ABC transporter permease [Streptomyces sp. CB01635]
MNLFKRAWWRLRGHLGKTVMLVGLFFVICTLVLSGFLIRSAAARAADSAKGNVGVVATMQLDVDALINSGGGSAGDGAQPGLIGSKGDLHSKLVDKICKSSVVAQCNYTVDSGAAPTRRLKLHQPVPAPTGQDTTGTDLFKASGVRDLDSVKGFHNGDSKILSGSGLKRDSKSDMIVIEERVAEDNRLKVGDKIKLRVGEIDPGKGGMSTKEVEFTVGGIYKNDTADTGSYVPAVADPSNQIYVTPEGATRLQGKEPAAGGAALREATFALRNPDDLGKLKDDAKAAGADLEIFPISVNDKQYKALVGPINKTADFASLTVWLVAIAGTVILALIIASNMRERRKELGILLSLGEKKPKLLGQHLVEVVACAVLAIGFAATGSQFIAQGIGDQLLSSQVSSAEDSAADQGPQKDPSDPNGLKKQDTPQSKPIDSMDIELGAGDIGAVGATGLGIAALATIVPGTRILRLDPRDILTKGD